MIQFIPQAISVEWPNNILLFYIVMHALLCKWIIVYFLVRPFQVILLFLVPRPHALAISRFSASSIVCILHAWSDMQIILMTKISISSKSGRLVLEAMMLIYGPPAWSLEKFWTRNTSTTWSGLSCQTGPKIILMWSWCAFYIVCMHQILIGFISRFSAAREPAIGTIGN